MRWAFLPYRRYFEFRGRSRRIEFWTFLLLWFVVALVLRVIDSQLFLMNAGPLTWLYLLGSFVPGLAVTVRRLHDANRTGWWALLPFTAFFLALAAVPFGGEVSDAIAFVIGISALVCPLALLVLLAWKSTPGRNRFGEDPKNPDADLEAVFS